MTEQNTNAIPERITLSVQRPPAVDYEVATLAVRFWDNTTRNATHDDLRALPDDELAAAGLKRARPATVEWEGRTAAVMWEKGDHTLLQFEDKHEVWVLTTLLFPVVR